MECKYDDEDVRGVTYVILQDEKLANIVNAKEVFNDGGITRVLHFFGPVIDREGYTRVGVGFPSKRLSFLYEEDIFRKAVIGHFFLNVN